MHVVKMEVKVTQTQNKYFVPMEGESCSFHQSWDLHSYVDYLTMDEKPIEGERVEHS